MGMSCGLFFFLSEITTHINFVLGEKTLIFVSVHKLAFRGCGGSYQREGFLCGDSDISSTDKFGYSPVTVLLVFVCCF